MEGEQRGGIPIFTRSRGLLAGEHCGGPEWRLGHLQGVRGPGWGEATGKRGQLWAEEESQGWCWLAGRVQGSPPPLLTRVAPPSISFTALWPVSPAGALQTPAEDWGLQQERGGGGRLSSRREAPCEAPREPCAVRLRARTCRLPAGFPHLRGRGRKGDKWPEDVLRRLLT